jgi:4-methylaminobutanoate oxidase (formaldehyde-forming)
MAEWIVDGEPSFDVWHMDINRFGRHYDSPRYTLGRTVENYRTYYDIAYPGLQRTSGRPLRTSPAYSWHRDHGAYFAEKAGWERVEYYRDNDAGGDPSLRPTGWTGRDFSPAVGAEHLATRAAAGLFDESSFALIEVSGPDAADLLEWVCDNRVARAVGAVTYTQALNRRGGIVSDFTVTRTGDAEFLVVTGTAYGIHDLAWLRTQARRRNAEVRIADVSGRSACFALWGPRSRDILSRLTASPLGNDEFRFMTSQQISVADVPVRALRVTFVGELGWELYTSPEYGAALWQALWEEGQPDGLVAGGYRAIDSMRIEKGFRVWGTDITAETTPDEAGLGFCVKLDKPGGFEGRDALVAARERGPTRRLCAITVDDPRAVVLGSEPIRIGERISGRVTSGGFGYSLGASLGFGYLDIDDAEPGTPVTIEMFGERMGGVVAKEPLLGVTS